MKSGIEILAPAGSFASLNAAINAGTDSVYLGVGRLNMRAGSGANFKIEDLPKIRKVTKENGVNVYITVNNLVYDSEIEALYELIDEIKKNNIDGIIAADMATVKHARSKDIEVHMSTQLSISNFEAVKYYSKFADRMVLARELNLEQIKEICEQIKKEDVRGPRGDLIEIEVFAHGALCVAVSGRCGMSLHCYGRSANRGDCFQPCRRSYKLTDLNSGKELTVDNKYVMSSADLCTIGMLPELLDTGVSVLKFEGRARPPEYVDKVIAIYKEAIESVYNEEYSQEKVKQWNKELGTVFNRGFSTNFYLGRTMDEWSGSKGSKATKKKVHVGEVKTYSEDTGSAKILVQANKKVQVGNEFVVIGEEIGVVRGKIEEMVINDEKVKKVGQGDEFWVKVKTKVNNKDTFYIFENK